MAACQQPDWKQVRAICEMLLSDRPSDSQVLCLLATVEKQLGHLSDAARYFEQSLFLDEANADSHHNYAVITGSFNWSPSAANQNDQVLMLIHSQLVAAHFTREINRL